MPQAGVGHRTVAPPAPMQTLEEFQLAAGTGKRPLGLLKGKGVFFAMAGDFMLRDDEFFTA